MMVNARVPMFTALVLVVVAAVGGVVWATGQDEPKPQGISTFMRAKLDHSKDILEGITTADLKKVGEGARALNALTEQERWRVSPNITYTRYTEEFQRLTDSLEAQAREENIDGATLSYVNLTINCVNCHKFVRDQRITGSGEPIRLR